MQPGITNLAPDGARANCMLSDNAQIQERIGYIKPAYVDAVSLDPDFIEASHLEKPVKSSAYPAVSDTRGGTIEHHSSSDLIA